jgi:hypothetical protein
MTYGIYDGSKIIAKFSAPVTLKSNVPVFASDTLSLKRFSTARPAQRWELETGLEPLTYNANELYVHLVTKGTTEEFKIITPQNFGVIASRTSSAAITATGSAGATQIFPALRVAVSATAVAHRDDVQMSCLYDIDTVSGMVYRDGIMMDVGTIKIIEKL